ncbi:3-hydroxyacyl-CoA dehydrogenase family protein [Planctomycetes bacterium K23_9]|uniref:Fatty acid oxidation complex subunit alpha n=1 Tax=Stieleria marina TaxID=1930275 RepID=A0A517NXJ2_9BACT|nr:Fatty acid oxidation complex subunit alpha [Planctomycetes bacterium K23_9]
MNALDPQRLPNTFLVGTGVVGRAIIKAHVASNIAVGITDQNAASLQQSVDEIATDWPQTPITWTTIDDGNLTVAVIGNEAVKGDQKTQSSAHPRIVVESIAERLDIKQAFFRDAERIFGDSAILCSNTSTLQIASIATGLRHPQRVCGMHFFMPVDQRPAVEIVRSLDTDGKTVAACQKHVQRLNKSPLVVADTPGFVVNRLLSPYLNQALLLLTRGISAERIEQAALRYGMPLSPLELIDYIGTRTMLNAGRCFWQAFPSRLDPSLVVPRLIKKKRLGRHDGAGLYDYHDGVRSESLGDVAQQIVAEYSVDPIEATDSELVELLAVPMWIEAALAYRDQASSSTADFNVAMQGGLGFRQDQLWLDFFDLFGGSAIRKAISKWSDQFASMQAPEPLMTRLEKQRPSEALSHGVSTE